MIICICNNINDKAISSAVRGGARDLDSVSLVTGAASCCGKCQFKVQRVIADELQKDDAVNLFYNAAASFA